MMMSITSSKIRTCDENNVYLFTNDIHKTNKKGNNGKCTWIVLHSRYVSPTHFKVKINEKWFRLIREEKNE